MLCKQNAATYVLSPGLGGIWFPGSRGTQWEIESMAP